MTSWENLWEAYRKAARGKRGRHAAASFEFQIADRLLDLQADLMDGTYEPGVYHHFTIHEPKHRKISAAPFRDRVVHHALCNVIEPHFEKRFHPNSFANRINKGTHRAVDLLQSYACRYRYALRLDIVKHFPSLDHAVLKQALFQLVKDEQIRWLIEAILKSGEGIWDEITCSDADKFGILKQPPHGLPIGNLTSQFWSNCYLNSLDWFVWRELGCQAYVRYVDDFVLFADSKKQLWQWRKKYC